MNLISFSLTFQTCLEEFNLTKMVKKAQSTEQTSWKEFLGALGHVSCIILLKAQFFSHETKHTILKDI